MLVLTQINCRNKNASFETSAFASVSVIEFILGHFSIRFLLRVDLREISSRVAEIHFQLATVHDLEGGHVA